MPSTAERWVTEAHQAGLDRVGALASLISRSREQVQRRAGSAVERQDRGERLRIVFEHVWERLEAEARITTIEAHDWEQWIKDAHAAGMSFEWAYESVTQRAADGRPLGVGAVARGRRIRALLDLWWPELEKQRKRASPAKRGRPRKPEGTKAVSWTGTFYPEDVARLQRLTAAGGFESESACVRDALRLASVVAATLPFKKKKRTK